VIKARMMKGLLVTMLLTPTIGHAQSTATKPFPPGFLLNTVKQMQAQGQASRMGPVTNGESNFGNVAPGFYRIHATNCVVLALDPVDNYGCIFSQEGFFVCQLNPASVTSSAVSAACVNGNFVGINVIDNNGDVNELITYPEK
jgi:hypothetical protein